LTNLADIRPHDFRRTCRTHLSSLGVRMEVAEAVLAHAEGNVPGHLQRLDVLAGAEGSVAALA
jgi:integrase